MKKNSNKYYYDAACDFYIKLTISEDKVVKKSGLEYYWGTTRIPVAGSLTNKPKPVTITQSLLKHWR